MTLESFPNAAQDLLDSLEPDNVDGYTVAVGNAFSGIQCHGFFEHFEEAISYAEPRYEEWSIVTIWKP